MGYRANERGKLSEDFVAAGDGLVAFGAALILAVQKHYGAVESLRGRRSAQNAATPNGPSCLITNAARFAPNRPTPAQSREGSLGPTPAPPPGWQPPGHRSRGRAALPATPTPAPERRAAAAGRCTPRRSRGTLKDGRRRPKPCGVCTPAAAPHRRRTARDARETRALGSRQNGWTDSSQH
jgi:hypothetical protein